MLRSVFAIVLALISNSAQGEELLVFAAISTAPPLEALAKYSPVPVTFSFAASNELARQIRAGAPADIFLSADNAKMDELQAANRLVAGTRMNLLSNQLAVVLRARSQLAVRETRDLHQLKRIALADPRSVPLGLYARGWLEREGLWETLKAKVLPLLDAKATLAAVESGAAEGGIVYKTDASLSKSVRVAFEVPVERAPAIVYPVARLARGRHPGAAAFLAFIASPRAKQTFGSYGFTFLPNQATRAD